MNVKGIEVKHKSFGVGVIEGIKDGRIIVSFSSTLKTFVFPDAFEVFLSTNCVELNNMIEVAKKKKEEEKAIEETKRMERINNEKRIRYNTTTGRYTQAGYSENSLLGTRAQDIYFESDYELFQVIGYLARPGRISSIEAEVPTDGRDSIFEKLFPGQVYRPISVSMTPSGLSSKMGTQLRIVLDSAQNCPNVLKMNMGTGSAGHAARINKSKFVFSLVTNYGFRFGYYQDVKAIREVAQRRGQIEAFEDGYNR